MDPPSAPHETAQRATLARVFPEARLLGFERLEGGISALATRWDVELPDGVVQRVVLRCPTWDNRELAVRRAQNEARVLQLIAGLVKAPNLVALDPQGPTLVLDYIEGAPCFTSPLSEAAVEQLACELATVHRVSESRILSFLPEREMSVDQLLKVEPATLDDQLHERQVRRLVRSWTPKRLNPPGLLHGDYWPGNVLWRQGKVGAIIDWEETERGDPLADLAVARLDLLWAFGASAMDQFTQVYVARTGVRVDDLPGWDLVAALRPMSQLAKWATSYAEPPASRPDVNEWTMRRDHRWFVEQAARALGR